QLEAVGQSAADDGVGRVLPGLGETGTEAVRHFEIPKKNVGHEAAFGSREQRLEHGWARRGDRIEPPIEAKAARGRDLQGAAGTIDGYTGLHRQFVFIGRLPPRQRVAFGDFLHFEPGDGAAPVQSGEHSGQAPAVMLLLVLKIAGVEKHALVVTHTGRNLEKIGIHDVPSIRGSRLGGRSSTAPSPTFDLSTSTALAGEAGRKYVSTPSNAASPTMKSWVARRTRVTTCAGDSCAATRSMS